MTTRSFVKIAMATVMAVSCLSAFADSGDGDMAKDPAMRSTSSQKTPSAVVTLKKHPKTTAKKPAKHSSVMSRMESTASAPKATTSTTSNSSGS